MKSITIKGNTLARELGYLAACIAVAVGANLLAIIKFHRPWTEFFSQTGFVAVITAVLFVYITIVRAVYHLARYGFNRIKSSHNKNKK